MARSLLPVLAATTCDGMLAIDPGAKVEQPAALGAERESTRAAVLSDLDATAASGARKLIDRTLSCVHA
jgi:hypothetical protein